MERRIENDIMRKTYGAKAIFLLNNTLPIRDVDNAIQGIKAQPDMHLIMFIMREVSTRNKDGANRS